MARQQIIPAMLILGIVLLGSTGCTTALKQAYYEVRGAQAEMLVNNVVTGRPLADHGGVEFRPARTDLSGRLCPPLLISTYDRFASRMERELAEVYTGDGPTVEIDTEVLYFQKKGILGSAQFLSRVRLISGDELIVDSLVDTRSKSFREGSEDDLAEAAINKVVEFLHEQKGVE